MYDQSDKMKTIEGQYIVNPKSVCRRCTRIVWSIVSNAEEKSSKASTDMLPLLRERNRSLTTFRITM